MKQNILITGYNYNLSKQVADMLADFFSMRVYSAIELFEFDNVPRSLSQMIALRGADYVRGKLASTLKGSFDFENIVFVSDLSMATTCKEHFFKIVSNYVVVLLKKSPAEEERDLFTANYTPEEKELLFYNKQQLSKLDFEVGEISDVVIDVSSKTDKEVFGEVVSAIKAIYNMH